VRVAEVGRAEDPPVVFFHGLIGLLDDTVFLDLLAERQHVFVAELPGYRQSSGEELLDDMLDFALHGWDVLAALDLGDRKPALIGHSLGE
jgi:pimeloyl-ACP methyl ester carboxylesterase